MAKKSAKRPGEKLGPVQTSIITLKGTPAYRDWLAAQSKRTHIPASAIVRLGLAMWAKENGGKAPPEK